MFAFIKRIAVPLAGLLTAIALKGATITNSVTFDFEDILQRAYTSRTVTIESASTPRTNNPRIAVNYYLSTNTGTSGSFVLSNMLDGTYRLSVLGSPRPTTFLIAVPTNNPGTHYASDLLTTNVDVNATTSWTRTQADGRYVRANSTNGALVSPTNFFWANITNGANVAIARGAGGRLTISSTNSGGGGGELWTTNASLLALASSNGVHLTNIVGASLITNAIHIFNRPNWPFAGSGNFRNATNEVSFFAAVDNGELQANTVYEFAPHTYPFTNVMYVRSNTVINLNGARLVLGTNATQVAESGKFSAIASKDYYSGGAVVRGGTIELQAHLNANFTNAMNGVTLWGNGKEIVEDLHVQNPKGNQISGSEGFAIALAPANDLANSPLFYAPRVTGSSVTFTNGTENQSYVTAISVGGRRDTNVVHAQGWALIDNSVVIGPGKGFGWSHGFSLFGRARLQNSHAEGLLRGVYHELQSGGNASTDNGMFSAEGNSFERVQNGVEIAGYLTNSNFRISGNVFSNFTYGVVISNTDASGSPSSQVGKIFDVMIDHNHFGVAGTNPHWNIYLRNVGGASMVTDNTFRSASNYLGTGTSTNLNSTNVVTISTWNNVMTNGQAAVTNLIAGNTTLNGNLTLPNYSLAVYGSGSIISNATMINAADDGSGSISWGNTASGSMLLHDPTGVNKNWLLLTDNAQNLTEEHALLFGNVDNTAPMILRPAGSNWITFQAANETSNTVFNLRGTLLTNGVPVPLHLIGTGGSGGGNVSATNNGASGEVAIYGGSDKMISFTNTLTSVVIDLDGVQTNTLLITGSDTYVRGAAPDTNQFFWSTNGFGIKSGARVTNIVFAGTNIISGPFTNNSSSLPSFQGAWTNAQLRGIDANGDLSARDIKVGGVNDFGRAIYFRPGSSQPSLAAGSASNLTASVTQSGLVDIVGSLFASHRIGASNSFYLASTNSPNVTGIAATTLVLWNSNAVLYAYSNGTSFRIQMAFP